MTLILTELSEHGVAMAADTALTKIATPHDRKSEPQVSHGVIKLLPIKELSAGISFYGNGMVGETRTDQWMDEFIQRNGSNYASMNSFGHAVADELNKIVAPVKVRTTLGFHLAGFEQTGNGTFPSAYKIINGTNDGKFKCFHSATLTQYPQRSREILRGGDAAVLVKVFELLERYLWQTTTGGPEPLIMPYPDNLRMRSEDLRFQIVTVSHIYTLSNQVPWIGGRVTTLSIASKGIENYETRAEITRGSS